MDTVEDNYPFQACRYSTELDVAPYNYKARLGINLRTLSLFEHVPDELGVFGTLVCMLDWRFSVMSWATPKLLSWFNEIIDFSERTTYVHFIQSRTIAFPTIPAPMCSMITSQVHSLQPVQDCRYAHVVSSKH